MLFIPDSSSTLNTSSGLKHGYAWIYVLQTGSAIGRPRDQRECLNSLSLGKIGKVRRLPDIPAVRGLVRVVHHLVLVLDYEPPQGLGVGQIVKQHRLKLGLSPRAYRALREGKPARPPGAKRRKRSRVGSLESGSASRIRALEEATARLKAFREDDSMDYAERLKLAAEPRRIHKQLFDTDPDVARQAAFALVCASKSFGENYECLPLHAIGEGDLERFRLDLQRLLPSLGDRFYSYIQTLTIQASPTRLHADFRLRLSRRLPFEVNGKAVVIDEVARPLRAGDDVEIFSIPEATVKLGERNKPGDPAWQTGDFFALEFAVELAPKEAKSLAEIPIAFAIEGIGASTLKVSLKHGRSARAVPFRASGSAEAQHVAVTSA